jgi:hypothetical protein
VLADASKLKRNALLQICGPERIDRLVTDKAPEPTLASLLTLAHGRPWPWWDPPPLRFFTVKKDRRQHFYDKNKNSCNSYENSVFGKYQGWKLCAWKSMAGRDGRV